MFPETSPVLGAPQTLATLPQLATLGHQLFNTAFDL